MATVANQIQQIYIGLLGRAADAEGLAYWTDEIESGALTLEQLRANIVEEQPEYLQGMGQMTRAQVVNQLYQNLFNRSAEPEGLDYWVNGGGSSVNVDQLVLALVDGAQAADTLALDNKTAVAEYYTEAAGENYSEAAARAAIANVDGSTDLAAARAAVDALLEGPASAETLTLTQRADDLQGADGVDTTFTAPVTQNETGSGQLANTFETGDVLDGGADSVNTLRADLIASGSIGLGGFQSPAISAETTNIQEVYFRAQNVQGFDQGSNTTAVATIDAEKMVGVEQWWTDNSRADVRIEDVRSRPTDTILGMRNTDPEVDLEVYFNPLFMDGGQSSESQLVIQIAELDGGVVNADAELQNISVSALTFELDGEAVTLSSDAMAAANTWEELEAAIVEALEAEGLGDLQVTRGNNGEFLLFDAEGREFSNQGGFTASATTDQQIDIRNRITQDLQTQDEQTETTLVLDGAGNGSRGGNVNIAAMSGDRGVEVFNVQVDNDSHIRTLRSENNPNNTGSYAQEQQLEEVYLTHVEGGAQGALQLGSRTVEQSGVSTTTDDRLVTDGLLDVRVFDAAGYAADIKLGASLTDAVFDKYLADAEETVQFSYLLGDGNNNLSLEVDNGVASDPDFALEIVGGAGDDRINLTDLGTKNTTVIDGGAGVNTVETNTSTGLAANGSDTWAGFENIQTLVVAGNGGTTQNLVAGNMEGLEDVIVATDGGVSTTMQQMRMDQDLTISGKNQTLGAGNNNDPQSFSVINVEGTSAVPGVDSFGITLDNTARVDGALTVGTLNVADFGSIQSDIRTLELTSAGRRDTSNIVQDFQAARATTLNLEGTQDLSIHVSDLATQPASDPALAIDGSTLGGDLTLAVNAGLLTNGADDVITGTAGENDILALYGAGGDIDTTINGIETIQFGWTQASDDSQFGGLFGSNVDGGAIGTDAATTAITFNAANAADTDTFIIALRGAGNGLTLDNLSSGSNVILGEEPGSAVSFNSADNTLIGTGELNLSLESVVAIGAQTNVEGFTTVNFDVASDGTPRTHTLNLDEDARDLFITGGGAAGDALDLDVLATVPGDEALPPSLSVVDFSGYEGVFNATVGDAGADNTDTRFVFSSDHNATISLIDTDVPGMADGWLYDGTNDYNAIFEFSEPTNGPVTWTINNFVTETEGAGNLGAISVLDMSDLDVNNYAELTFTDNGGDLEISSAGADWTIVLTGVVEADLESSQNFFFS